MLTFDAFDVIFVTCQIGEASIRDAHCPSYQHLSDVGCVWYAISVWWSDVKSRRRELCDKRG